MAGIKWWTPERLDALRACVLKGLSWRLAALALTRRYRRRVTQRAAQHAGRAAGIDGGGKAGRPRTPHRLA
jgi:hypothetical protein